MAKKKKFVEKVADLVGKTVKSAVSDSLECTLTFTDGTEMVTEVKKVRRRLS